jgi:hypothetical protein
MRDTLSQFAPLNCEVRSRHTRARRLHLGVGSGSYLDLGAAGGCRRRFLGGFRGGRCFAAPLGLGWRGRSFTDQFRRHDAGDEQLGAVIVEIHRGALHIGGGHDSQAVHSMLDGLTFLHYLHNVLLDHSYCFSRFESLEEAFRRIQKALPSQTRGL